MDPTSSWVFALLYARALDLSLLTAVCQLSSHQSTPTQHDLSSAHRLLNYVSSHPNPHKTIHPSSMASCPELSRAVWLAARLGLVTPHPTFLTHPRKSQTKLERQTVPCPCLLPVTIPPLLSHTTPCHPQRPLHAFCQRIPVVVASVTEAEYAAAFGGGQVLVELTLTLTNLGHPQQSHPLLFVDNECAIVLATSSVRPKKSKSIDMRLDWIKERAGQNCFRLVFLPGLINPADFFTKILPTYRHIAAIPFLQSSLQSSRCSHQQGPPYLSLPLTQPHFFYTCPRPLASM
jgi:hypothetical protein